MKERINWIDWAKALAVCCVVFCHLPQSQEWYYYRFLQATIITIFFWVSGYLKKDRGSTCENWRKYWYGLIIPYIIYNVIVYPYWLLKYYILNGGWPDVFSALKPVFGALLFENENAFCEPLNGPLWYLPAILVMHILIDICRKTHYQHLIMITLCTASYFVYAANKQYEFLPNLTFLSASYYDNALHCILLRLCSQQTIRVSAQLDFYRYHQPIAFLLSRLCDGTEQIIPQSQQNERCSPLLFTHDIGHPILPMAHEALNGVKNNIITKLSIGTLVIIGLHIVLVTIANYTLEHIFGINGGICYHWYTAIPTTLAICATLYPIILWTKQHLPILLGRKAL